VLVELLVGLREYKLAVDDFGADGWRIFRSSAWAQVAPKSPVDAPDDATGLLRRTLVAIGREIQSRAFLSAPGTDALYSGVANRTALAPAI
jgi:hypothetical protein